ncbi:lpqC [alpha proteobacterium U9-1i]|nr:lpqC [alpha proteobacterium U9-1i]
MIRTALTVIALLWGGAPAFAQPARQYADAPIYSIEHAGARRAFALHTPTSFRRGGPLIVALHGRFSSPKAFQALSGLNAIGDVRGALVAYPQAGGALWNDGANPGLARIAAPMDDAGFIAAMIATLVEEYGVGAERVFIVGFDSGGVMAQHLACDGSMRLAGVAVVSAPGWSYMPQSCARATPAIVLHGRRDLFVPVGGDAAEGDAPHRLSAADTIARWLSINRCADQANERRGASLYYSACSGAPFAYVAVERGGHEWFQSGDGRRINRSGVSAATTVDAFFFARESFALPRGGGSMQTGRSYIVYAPPSYDPARPMPVVVALHGRPSNAPSMAAITEFHAVAEREGFIVVYPDGVGGEWRSVADLIGLANEYPNDDVAFLGNLIDDLSLDLNIDQQRLYITGFSNGGFMTMRMACEASDRFAAFASVGAALYNDIRDVCRRGSPAPIMFIHGTADRSIAFDGVVQRSQGEARQVSMSVPNTVSYFANRNGCSPQARRIDFTQGSPDTQVIRFDQIGCANNNDVTFFLVNGGGHVWPGVQGVLPEENFGPTNMDISASQVIWDFFKQHTLDD